MQLSDIILQSAQAALSLQSSDGSFPAGHNGPYCDKETPVRNTAHWLITLLKAYELSGDAKFKDAASRATDYLAAPEARPMKKTFFCRTKPGKDFCNGLIGQAWAIEALVLAAEKLEDHRSLELAKEVFLLHPFDYEVGLWRCVNVDGSYAKFDMTFNHQLWFAAAGAMLLDTAANDSICRPVIRFLDRAQESHLQVDTSGRIIHEIELHSNLNVVAKTSRFLCHPLLALREKAQMAHKEIGYHAFNLYAFALLKQRLPEHAFWHSEKFKSLLNFINRIEFITGLDNNKFGYPYNPPGFEVAFAIQVFDLELSSGVKPAEWWVEQQLLRCYSLEEKMMNRNTEDPETSSARIYEATRLEDMEINIG